MPDQITIGNDAPLSLTALLVALAIGAAFALALRWHFLRFGSTHSNRAEFSLVFPFVLLTTILIITVVKSSLALSLGLVGALSIVRFRTPVKEPEELAYLFMAIALGLGLGAGQTLATTVAGIAILGAMAAFKWTRGDDGGKNLFLSVALPSADPEAPSSLQPLMALHAEHSDLRRFDLQDQRSELVYFLDLAGPERLAALSSEIRRRFPGASVTFLDQTRMPSL
jgi:hypothetical protein